MEYPLPQHFSCILIVVEIAYVEGIVKKNLSVSLFFAIIPND